MIAMAAFKGAVLNCAECGVEFKVPPSRAASASTCSKACADKRRGLAIERKVEKVCRACGETFRVPRCHEARRVFCSRACHETHPETVARKADRVGEKNSAWTGGRVGHSGGYVYESAYGHPLSSGNYVLQHRLVMERWLLENDPLSEFLVEVDGRRVLSPAYHVHHENEVRTDNAIENLKCMTPAEHRAHHYAIVRKALAFYRQHHPLT